MTEDNKKSPTNIELIKKCINEAHSFSKGLGGSSSLSRDHITTTLNDISATDIHIALIELKEKGQIEYDSDSGLITIKKKF